MSCSRVPRGFHFTSQCPMFLDVDQEERRTLNALQLSFGGRLTRLALSCVRRNLKGATEELSELSSHVDAGSGPTTAFELTLQQYATALDSRLRATREKKWHREGIRPHPLMNPPIAEPKREKRGRRAGGKVQRLRQKKLSETPTHIIEQAVVTFHHTYSPPRRCPFCRKD